MAIRELSKELALKAFQELNEDPKRIPSDIETVRAWMKMQPHLAHIKILDQTILAHLRGTKFSVERCKEKLDMFYTMKNLAPEILLNKDPSDKVTQDILKLGVTLPFLDVQNATDTRVFMVRLGAFNPSKYSLIDVFKVSSMISDIMLQEDDHYGVSGQLLLLDLKGVTMELLPQATTSLAKKISTIGQKIHPTRQKGFHLINPPIGFEAAFTLFRGFFSDKLKKRIHVHNVDMKSLQEHIPNKLLPKEYGGDGNTIQELIDHWKRKVESYQDWYIEEGNYKSNEKLRPGKPNTAEEMFGIAGSFRKLDLD